MNYYPVKIEEIAEGLIRKKRKKIIHVKFVSDAHTLAEQKKSEAIQERVYKKLGIKKKYTKKALQHTFPPAYIRAPEGESGYRGLLSPSLENAIKLHTFFQLLGLGIAALKRKGVSKDALNRAMKECWNALSRKNFTNYRENVYISGTPGKAYEHIPFEEIRKRKDQFVDVVSKKYALLTGLEENLVRQIAERAIDISDTLGEKISRDKELHVKIKAGRVEELEKYLEFLAESSRKQIEPKKSKYPATKKVGRKELGEARGPEQQVNVVAPRLAMAVWLENQLRVLKESTSTRLYGGVPIAELRNFREKVLAKKHVTEKATEIIENYWMKGMIVPLKEEHLDPKMLPFVREHASGMMEDIKNLAERVKRGEVDPQDVRNILAIERDLLDRTHEAIEKTMGNLENLMENRRAYGVEDKFMVKKEALEKIYRELKPHFETARVKIPVKMGNSYFEGF